MLIIAVVVGVITPVPTIPTIPVGRHEELTPHIASIVNVTRARRSAWYCRGRCDHEPSEQAANKRALNGAGASERLAIHLEGSRWDCEGGNRGWLDRDRGLSAVDELMSGSRSPPLNQSLHSTQLSLAKPIGRLSFEAEQDVDR
jgi:hypothetical protein